MSYVQMTNIVVQRAALNGGVDRRDANCHHDQQHIYRKAVLVALNACVDKHTDVTKLMSCI